MHVKQETCSGACRPCTRRRRGASLWATGATRKTHGLVQGDCNFVINLQKRAGLLQIVISSQHGKRLIVKSDDDDDDGTPSAQRCVQAVHVQKTRGLPLGRRGHPQGQGPRKPVERPLGQRVASGETHVCQPSQGTGKIGLSLLTCAVSRRLFRSKKKQRSVCGSYVCASWNSVAVTRTLVTYKRVHVGPLHVATASLTIKPALRD